MNATQDASNKAQNDNRQLISYNEKQNDNNSFNKKKRLSI